MRRVHLKGRDNILKRLLLHAGGFNLALVLRKVLVPVDRKSVHRVSPFLW
jgi:hypothetical protein